MKKSPKGTLTRAKPTVVKANEFVLTDSTGAARARLGLDSKGYPGLQFFDTNGKLRMKLLLEADGTSGLVMYNRGKPKVHLVLGDGAIGPLLRLEGSGSRFEVLLNSEDGFSSVALERERVG